MVTSPFEDFKIGKIVQKIQFDFYIYIAVDSSNVSEEDSSNVSQEDLSDLPNGASAHPVGERREEEVSPLKPPK